MELSCVSYISTWIWKKMSKAIISDCPNTSSTQQAAPPRIMHLQFSMQKKVCIFSLVQLGGEKRTFSIEAGEGGACLKIALWKTNLWSWLFLCALFSGCGFYASFWREIRIWCKIFFKPFCLDQFWKEERYGVVICNLVGSKKCKFRSAPRAIILCQRRKTNCNAGQSNIIVSRTLFQFLLCSCSCCLDSIVSICKHLVVKLYIQSIVLLAQVWQDVSKSHLRPCCALATWWETDMLYNTLYTSKQTAVLNCIGRCTHLYSHLYSQFFLRRSPTLS